MATLLTIFYFCLNVCIITNVAAHYYKKGQDDLIESNKMSAIDPNGLTRRISGIGKEGIFYRNETGRIIRISYQELQNWILPPELVVKITTVKQEAKAIEELTT